MENVGGLGAYSDVPSIQNLNILYGNIISIVLSISGVVLFIMFIIGGFKFLTSSGDPDKAKAAQSVLTSAITGIVVLVLAFIILKIIGSITGNDLTRFNTVFN